MTTARRCVRTAAAGLFAAFLAGAAQAHTLVVPYTLPVPFWLYLFACGATLVLTFAVLGIASILGGHKAAPARGAAPVTFPIPPAAIAVLRGGAVAALALTLLAGPIGSASPNVNVNMTLFWIVFLLGFTYLVALVGNIYEAINPWRAIASLVGLRKWPGRIPYPEGLAYWPAFAFYLGLIWLELMVLPRPLVLSQVLFAYTIVTLAAAWLFGTAAWFRHGEVFAVLLRLVGTLAPVAYERGPGGEWRGRLRLPLSGTVEDRPEHVSLVLFVLFMLSSTTYDGLHETTLWVGLYWTNFLALFEPVWGSDMAKAQAILAPGYALFQNLGLLISPFAYFAIYLAVIAAVKWATGSRATHLAIARDFAFSVIPIAFVYNVAHYFTALLGVWPTLPYLASIRSASAGTYCGCRRRRSRRPSTWQRSGTRNWR